MDSAKGDLFLQHLRPLLGILEAYGRRSLYDSNAIQDVLQSAVAGAYRDFDLYVQGSNFRAWMFRYLHHEIQTANRKSRRDSHEPLPEELAGQEAWEPAEDVPLQRTLMDDPDEVLDKCDGVLVESIRNLNTQERDALLLHAIGEFKYREIADILNIPVGTVMSSLARCRARLRHQLAEFGRERGLLTDEPA